jgi:hypothetical protein
VGESFAFLAASPYIRDMAALVVAYGISINLVEVTWKSKIKAQFPNPNDYSAFMGDFSTATGAVTFTMMILSRYIFRYFGWGVAALITPTVLLITGILFFSLVLFSDSVAPTLKALGLTPLMAAVLVGAAQNVFSKSSKYSLFDPCKEMAVSGGAGLGAGMGWLGMAAACRNGGGARRRGAEGQFSAAAQGICDGDRARAAAAAVAWGRFSDGDRPLRCALTNHAPCAPACLTLFVSPPVHPPGRGG